MSLIFIFLLSTITSSAFSTIEGQTTSSGAYHVDNYGAKGDGQSDDSQAIMKAWNAACGSTGSPTIVIPSKKYLVGPLQFEGPCSNTGVFTVQVDGVILASTNLSLYKSEEWILFTHINNLKLTGTGTFDGQGERAWPQDQCPFNLQCRVLPVSLKFAYLSNTEVEGITSLNPKFFHMALLNNKNFKIHNIKATAPKDSPNTDGIHLEGCIGVRIMDSSFATGDDCISVGQGNNDVYITNINCGPGHGISVGSLGRYAYEKDVDGLVVTGCNLTGTMNGVRIKSWQASPVTISARNITFDHIIVENVGNPIIIDQKYCPFRTSCTESEPSRVRLSDITFSNIIGTSISPVAVNLQCSAGFPCEDIKLQNINITYTGSEGATTSTCANVNASYSGLLVPVPCVLKN
ncbi:unnamed protein product [Victoria cruziana]